MSALGELERRRVREAREQHVLEPLEPARASAALMRGFAWPNRFTHHELMPSR